MAAGPTSSRRLIAFTLRTNRRQSWTVPGPHTLAKQGEAPAGRRVRCLGGGRRVDSVLSELGKHFVCILLLNQCSLYQLLSLVCWSWPWPTRAGCRSV